MVSLPTRFAPLLLAALAACSPAPKRIAVEVPSDWRRVDFGGFSIAFPRDRFLDGIDNGCGMDNKFIAERLFKPFDTTKGNAGMGIGVYEARDYIQKLGGSCTVDSIPGSGTTFTIQLPLAPHFENHSQCDIN